jgi:tRNA (guanine10-N2)-methyltransferase
MAENLLPKYNYNVLIEFAHIHVDFQRSELQSVLEMHGLLQTQDYTEIPLPNIYNGDSNHPSLHRAFMILSFSIDRLNNARILRDDPNKMVPESLMDRYCTQKTAELPPTLAIILSQCTLVRSAIELWGFGSSFEECTLSIKSQIADDGISHNTNMGVIWDRLNKVCTDNQSWKITIQTLGRTFTREDQEEMRSHFRFLDFPGPVKMNEPENEFIIIREIELDTNGSPAFPKYDHNKQLIQENDQRPPLGIYFGRILGHNRNYRSGIEKFNLKKRVYLGPTSMDAELSFIMTSLAQVKQGSFCFDPFVGTGSLLLTCAMKGAGMCLGTDIDIRVLRGRNMDETIYNNFSQYGLVRPELIRSDNAIFHRHYRSMHSMFDAIVTGKSKSFGGICCLFHERYVLTTLHAKIRLMAFEQALESQAVAWTIPDLCLKMTAIHILHKLNLISYQTSWLIY